MSLSLDELSQQVGQSLQRKRLTVAAAESCTGGWIAKVVTDTPGSSAWFAGGVVAYSNGLKTSLLSVPAGIIESSGAVSEAVARAMAEGARMTCGAGIAVAVTGVAGPEGGTPDKPVGTVWFAWSLADQTLSEMRQFQGDRKAVRRQAVEHALRRIIQITD